MVASAQFRPGNVVPSKDNLEFIEQCAEALPDGVRVARLRVDAEGCQAAIVDYVFEQNIAFATRARLRRRLCEQIRHLSKSRWQPVMNCADDDEICCRLVHSMQASKQAVTLVVQRRPIRWSIAGTGIGRLPSVGTFATRDFCAWTTALGSDTAWGGPDRDYSSSTAEKEPGMPPLV